MSSTIKSLFRVASNFTIDLKSNKLGRFIQLCNAVIDEMKSDHSLPDSNISNSLNRILDFLVMEQAENDIKMNSSECVFYFIENDFLGQLVECSTRNEKYYQEFTSFLILFSKRMNVEIFENSAINRPITVLLQDLTRGDELVEFVFCSFNVGISVGVEDLWKS
jgi:hypothetical protein